MSNQYDCIIVGGGVAGSSMAIVMARAGARVLVLEKERRFRDRVRGEFLAPWGIRDLADLGLAESFLAAGAIPLPALAGRSLKPRPVQSPDGDPALSFSHVAVQDELLATALASGAEFVRGLKVTDVSNGDPARVTFEGPDGRSEATARLVVGADGRNSLMRRALGRPEQVQRSPRFLAGVRLANVTADPSFGYFILSEEDGGLAALFPQGDGMARAYLFLGTADASAFSGAGKYDQFIETLTALGVPTSAVRTARQAGPLGTFIADDSWVEHPASGSLVLLGDAAGISDPTWGQGIALALRDVRTLSTELLRDGDWSAAADAYARARDAYFRTIVTAESWQTELQLTPGEAAARRRAHALALWRQDPSRALDLPGLGPAVDVSPRARLRFFGEDVPSVASNARAEPLVEQIANALAMQNFESFGALLSPTVRFRALLPGGPIEARGKGDTVQLFYGWFGDVEEIQLLDRSSEELSDRTQICWRVLVRWTGEDFPRVIEQTGYAKLVDGLIATLDVVCSGFRPTAVPLGSQAAA